jgi:hypothetical protein
MIPVVIAGTIMDVGSGVNASTATYALSDEYERVQPSGGVSLGADGSYTFTVLLEASRLGDDKDGRQYIVTVRAQDQSGNSGSSANVVTVPHDMRRGS